MHSLPTSPAGATRHDARARYPGFVEVRDDPADQAATALEVVRYWQHRARRLGLRADAYRDQMDAYADEVHALRAEVERMRLEHVADLVGIAKAAFEEGRQCSLRDQDCRIFDRGPDAGRTPLARGLSDDDHHHTKGGPE